mmetsp:Transcript_11657/g.27916  ORF Transcript_11657/g.27916 Transcript_11657/m.27916 type:complete len:705 (+) Transcript_11657:81-2195(+)
MENFEAFRDQLYVAIDRGLSSSEEVREQLEALWQQLDVPPSRVVTEAFKECWNDTYRATMSATYFLYLILRPVCILVWIVLQNVWAVIQEHGGRSLQHAFKQFKTACIWFYNFQLSLTWKQVLGEIFSLSAMVGSYYLYKWLQRQSYWSRAVAFVQDKKHRLVEGYTKFVHRVAQVSTILALAMPHIFFLTVCIGIRVLTPTFARWIVHDTILTDMLSVYYPFMCTLFLVTNRRHPTKAGATISSTPSGKNNKKDDDNNIDTTTTATKPKNGEKKNDSSTSSLRRRKASSTSPSKKSNSGGGSANGNVPAEYSRDTLTPTGRGGTCTNVSSSSRGRSGMSPQDTTTYWLRYWHVFGIVQAVGMFLSSIPIFGSFVMRHPLLLLLTAELKTLFFVWLFGMEWILPSSKDAFLADALPLRLVHRFVTPILLKFYTTVSDAVPQKLWQRWVVSKSETLLQAFVLIRVLSSERKDWIVNTLKESKSLIVPSITLFMPGFITQFGVAFVQYILPSAKSAQARGDPKRVLYLQYWIMHCMFSSLLSIFSGVIWWVPFSTHVIFIAWCYLALPDTIRVYYDIIESDLAAFGILKVTGNVASDINDTTTAKLLSAVTSRLPSASSSDENDITKTGSSTATNDETANNKNSNKNGDDSLPELEAKTSTLALSQDESDNEKSTTTKSARRSGGGTFSATTGLEDNDVKSDKKTN